MLDKNAIIEKIESFPPISSAAMELLPLLKDKEVNINKVVQTIEFDPALTSDILRLVNSVLFGGVRQISSIKESVIRLGMKNIYEMVLLIATQPHYSSVSEAYDHPPEMIWEHSMAVALGVETMGKALGLKLPHYAFTAGMLHDIGKLVLCSVSDASESASMAQDLTMIEGISFEEAEKKTNGMDHAEIGAELLKQWNIPENIYTLVRWHHEPGNFPGDKPVCHLLKTVDALFAPDALTGGDYQLPYESVKEIGVTIEIVDNVRNKVMSELAKKKQMLSANA